jgi:hypothetical protein|tara:strand:+ start:70 stop:327 length:258 start_codon:yes stop_codon:yes gene_type:complete
MKAGKTKPSNKDRDYALSLHSNAISSLQAQVSELYQLIASYIEYKGDTDELTNYLTELAKKKAQKQQTPKIVDSSGKPVDSKDKS